MTEKIHLFRRSKVIFLYAPRVLLCHKNPLFSEVPRFAKPNGPTRRPAIIPSQARHHAGTAPGSSVVTG